MPWMYGWPWIEAPITTTIALLRITDVSGRTHSPQVEDHPVFSRGPEHALQIPAGHGFDWLGRHRDAI